MYCLICLFTKQDSCIVRSQFCLYYMNTATKYSIIFKFMLSTINEINCVPVVERIVILQ
jgi:hypothetical protein